MATFTAPEISAPFESLPLDVLEVVCEHLVHCDPKRRSLFAFALTSKGCCFAATRQRFERIKLTLRSREKLRYDLERWNAILGEGGRAGHVRRLKVVGGIPRICSGVADGHDGTGDGVAAAAERVAAVGNEEEEEKERKGEEEEESESEDGFEKPSTIPMEFHSSSPPLTEEEKQRQDEEWLPLAHFIKDLPGLKDLIYASIDPIPRCIVSTLHQHHPNSRLHVHMFSLRSLYQTTDRPHDIDLDEYTLAASPCLYSIVVPYHNYDTYGRVSYNYEAVMCMVARLAPRLRLVQMLWSSPGDSLDLRNATKTLKPAWQGFFPGKPEYTCLTGSIGRLRSLVLVGSGSVNSTGLLTLRNYTEFSKLQSLQMQGQLCLSGLRTLTRMAEDGIFKSLRKLVLWVSPFKHQEEIHMDEATSQLLAALHSLEDLELIDHIADRTFDMVLNRHGKTLLKLKFIPNRCYGMKTEDSFAISPRRIQELQQRCPNLREVTLLIPRTKGDKQEVEIYRALGGFPRLKRVSLLLDCSAPEIPPGSVIRNEQTKNLGGFTDVPAKEFRNAFIRTAIDSSLAVSIFRAISTTNALTHPTRHPSFQYLKLEPRGAADFGQGWNNMDLEYIMQWLRRSWVCERDQRDDHADEVVVREIAKSQRRRAREELDWALDDGDGLYGRIWRSLWPDRTGDWRENWSSSPLWDG